MCIGVFMPEHCTIRIEELVRRAKLTLRKHSFERKPTVIATATLLFRGGEGERFSVQLLDASATYTSYLCAVNICGVVVQGVG